MRRSVSMKMILKLMHVYLSDLVNLIKHMEMLSNEGDCKINVN